MRKNIKNKERKGMKVSITILLALTLILPGLTLAKITTVTKEENNN